MNPLAGFYWLEWLCVFVNIFLFRLQIDLVWRPETQRFGLKAVDLLEWVAVVVFMVTLSAHVILRVFNRAE